jgi:hypothetical protein
MSSIQPFQFVAVLSLILFYGPILPFGTSSASAMETDNFTDRYAPARDALPELDRFTSGLLDRALEEANAPRLLPSPACSRMRLMAALKKHLGATPVGQVEAWARSTPELDRLQPANIVDIDHDIYRGIPLWQYPLMKGGIDPSVRAAGIVVGVDKFGHFLAEGLHYYEQSRSWIENLHPGSKSALLLAMSWGEQTEDTYFGLGVSGVRSYADLSANLAGYRFWASITEGKTPYFACEGGAWARVREFTWADHLSDAWDEGINCSEATGISHTSHLSSA